MSRNDMVALGRVVLARREHVIALEPKGRGQRVSKIDLTAALALGVRVNDLATQGSNPFGLAESGEARNIRDLRLRKPHRGTWPRYLFRLL